MNPDSDDIEIPQPNSKLGPRLAAAFAALVALNVTVGLLFIIGNKKSEKSSPGLGAKELAAREQIAASLEKSAETAFPVPTLDVDEIRLTAAPSEREEMANNVVMLAKQHGGSATKAPPDDTGITVLAEMPTNRAEEFRRSLAPLAPADFSETKPSRETRSMSDKVNIYVRISQALPSPTP